MTTLIKRSYWKQNCGVDKRASQLKTHRRIEGYHKAQCSITKEHISETENHGGQALEFGAPEYQMKTGIHTYKAWNRDKA
jgi:hypothetical protein